MSWIRFIPLLLIMPTVALSADKPQNRTSSWTRHPNICELNLASYGKDFTLEEELENFWEFHPRFGIVKNYGRHYLVTKDQTTAVKLIKDLAIWAQALGEKVELDWATVASLPEMNRAVVYDITDILPSKAQEFHAREARNSVNCWNFACFNAETARGIFGMTEPEFHFLIESPLSKKLKPNEPLIPGDIIVIRRPDKDGPREFHAVVYVSEDLVFGKESAFEGPFRLQDAREMLYSYGTGIRLTVQTGNPNAKPIHYSEPYRMSSLNQYIRQNQQDLSQEVLSALSSLKLAEEASTIEKTDSEGDFLAARNRKWALTKKLQPVANQKLANPLYSYSPAERFLWQLIKIRLGSL